MNRIGGKSDVLCRYGGDEFCMFMPNTELQGALTCAERIRTTVVAEKQLFAEAGSFPTVTIGVATKTKDMEDADALLEKADQALIWAKLNTRNAAATYDASQATFLIFRKMPVD